MCGWPGLNVDEWDDTDLIAAISEYQPPEDYCCCLAVQREIVVIDADILYPEHATYASELADTILGATPLSCIGQGRNVRIYRAGDPISRENFIP